MKVRKAGIRDIVLADSLRLDVYKGETNLVPGFINFMQSGECHALTTESGDLVGVVGGIVLWDGVADIAAIFTEAVHLEPISLIRTTRAYIGEMMEKWKLHRVQMAVKWDYDAGHRWAKAIGFEFEGVLS